MQRSVQGFVFLCFTGFAALACVTINVYFPEAAVKDLSEKIEDAVAREAAEIGEEDTSSQPGSSPTGTDEGAAAGQVSWLRHSAEIVIGTALHLLAPAPVYAQTNEVAAPEISNPAIRKIIASRAARVADINRFKASGAIGENNEALVVVRQLDALPLQQRAAVQKLVKAENADRNQMFEEIAAATSTDLQQLPRIRSTYASTLRQKARRGDWIQMPDGSWKAKP